MCHLSPITTLGAKLTKESMQPWMLQMLVTKGVISESGLTRKAKIVRHRKCGILTLAGFDSDLAAMDTWCDLAELSVRGEAGALVAGRCTYEVWVDRLCHRDVWAIKGRPAGSIRVLASHRCDELIPAEWLLPVRPAVEVQTFTPTEGDPPF